MELSVLEERIRNSYRYITKRMKPNEEDDCVQECLLRFHLNGFGQTVDQAVIDYLRKYVAGRKGSPGYEQKLNLHNALEIPEHLVVETEDTERIDVTYLPQKLRWIVESYIQGYEMKEIGASLGVSESRVSQMIKEYTERAPFISLLPRNIRKAVASYVF